MIRKLLAGGVIVFALLPRGGQCQPAKRDTVVTMTRSLPLRLPTLFYLNVLPQRLPADDSLARLVHARQRVKTIVLQRLGRTDTTEYTELDRRGNQTLVAKPYFGQHVQQRFDKRNRLVEYVRLPTDGFAVRSRTLFEPEKQLYTTYITEMPATGQPAAPALWQQSQRLRHGDTLITESVFLPVPGLEGGPTGRLRIRGYHLGPDTTFLVAVGYDAADQPVEFVATYAVSKAGRLLENGSLDYRPTPQMPPPPAAELLRLARYRRARLVPGNRYDYDGWGLLVRSSYIADLSAVPDKPAKSSAADGSWSMTTRSETRLLGYSTRYLRNPDGQVQREERTFQLRPGIADSVSLQMYRPTAIDYEYSATGLLLRKTDSASLNGKPLVYEVKYTYY
jgi:hypothetical protein